MKLIFEQKVFCSNLNILTMPNKINFKNQLEVEKLAEKLIC